MGFFWPVLFVLVLLIPILAIVLDSQLGRALAARLEGRRIGEGDELLGERIAYLEGEVDRLNSEIHRLTEESDFLHKLLTERSSAHDEDPAPPPGERPD